MRVRKALSSVYADADPAGQSIIAAGRVDALSISPEGTARFILSLDKLSDEAGNALLVEARNAVETAIETIEGVVGVSAIATRHTSQQSSKNPSHSPDPKNEAQQTGKQNTASHDNPLGLKKSMPSQPTPQAKQKRIDETSTALEHVAYSVAIASGKGGVGKSTLTAGLAVALAAKGLRVGLLDADISGPSQPTIFGLTKETASKPAMIEGRIQPVDVPITGGAPVKVMSIGLLVDPDKAVAWRGPMVMGAIRQLINDVDWGTLDILLIDTPPGTGDVHLTLVRSGLLSGAIIVTTPQQMALADVRRGLSLFEQTNIPVLGLVENMAWLTLPDGTRQYIFGQAGGETMADAMNTPFLGAMPIDTALREACDLGAMGETMGETQTASSAKLEAVAEKLMASLEAQSG